MGSSNRGTDTLRSGGGTSELARRAVRYASGHLAGLPVINDATQLAITLTPEALMAAASSGAPADFLRLFPRLPQMLAHALYVRTTADALRRPDIRRVYVLAASGATLRQPFDVLFRVRENFQGQSFLDRVLARRPRVNKRADGGDVPDESANAARSNKATPAPRYIFVGGAWDRDGPYHPVEKYVDNFKRMHPEADVHYLPWDDTNGLLSTIRNAPAGAPVYVTAHSYGANAAPYAIGYMAFSGIHVNKLITIDPVGRTPIPDGLRGAVDHWTNVTAAPSTPNASDTIAALGGKGGRLPVEQADSNYPLDTNHANFSTMMTKPDPTGVSPEEFLLGNPAPLRTSPRLSGPSGGNSAPTDGLPHIYPQWHDDLP